MYGVVYTKTVSECVKHETLLISLMTHSNAWHVYICASCARGLCWLPSCWIICECMCVCNQNVCLHAYAYWSIDVHDKGVYCLHMICCHIGTPHYCRCENFHKKIFHGLNFQIFLCWTHYWNFNLAKKYTRHNKNDDGGQFGLNKNLVDTTCTRTLLLAMCFGASKLTYTVVVEKAMATICTYNERGLVDLVVH